MTSGERLKIEREVAARRAGDADLIVVGIVMLIVAAFVVGVAVGWFAATGWVP